jgi:hypothetical protein
VEERGGGEVSNSYLRDNHVTRGEQSCDLFIRREESLACPTPCVSVENGEYGGVENGECEGMNNVEYWYGECMECGYGKCRVRVWRM